MKLSKNPKAFILGASLRFCREKRKRTEKPGKFTGKSDILSGSLVSATAPLAAHKDNLVPDAPAQAKLSNSMWLRVEAAAAGEFLKPKQI